MPLAFVTTLFLGLVLARQRAEREIALAAKSSGPAFTMTVDWYKPAPSDEYFRNSFLKGFQIPGELFVAVPFSLRDEATVLLGDNDIIPLTKEQAKQLSAAIDPSKIVQSITTEKREKLRFFSKPERLTGSRGRQREEVKAGFQYSINHLSSEIQELERWHHLQPYLIKAVGLETGGSFFGWQSISEDELMIVHGALGSHPVPMERRPVVAFLPRKPRKIYTAVGMME